MAKDTTTCIDVLKNYFRANPQTWIKKVQFYSIAEDWSPETVGRKLRLIAEDETQGIKVDYYPAKYTKRKLAMYSLGEIPQRKPIYQEITKPDGTRVMQLI